MKAFEVRDGVWGGIPVFPSTRIPIYFFIDFLEDDATIGEFLEDYEIDKTQIDALLRSPLPPKLR